MEKNWAIQRPPGDMLTQGGSTDVAARQGLAKPCAGGLLRDHDRVACLAGEEVAHGRINAAAMSNFRAHRFRARRDFTSATREFDQKIFNIIVAIKSAPHLFRAALERDNNVISLKYSSRRPRRSFATIGQHIPIRRLDEDQLALLQKNITWT